MRAQQTETRPFRVARKGTARRGEGRLRRKKWSQRAREERRGRVKGKRLTCTGGYKGGECCRGQHLPATPQRGRLVRRGEKETLDDTDARPSEREATRRWTTSYEWSLDTQRETKNEYDTGRTPTNREQRSGGMAANGAGRRHREGETQGRSRRADGAAGEATQR